MKMRISTIVILAVSAVLFYLSANSYGLGVTLGAFFTLGIFSFLYEDNPYYKFCEAVFVGISAGYWFHDADASGPEDRLDFPLGARGDCRRYRRALVYHLSTVECHAAVGEYDRASWSLRSWTTAR